MQHSTHTNTSFEMMLPSDKALPKSPKALPKGDAPGPRRSEPSLFAPTEPSIHVPPDAHSLLASNIIPSSFSNDYDNDTYDMNMTIPYRTTTDRRTERSLAKALPKFKKSNDEKSESTIINPDYRYDEKELSICRPHHSNIDIALPSMENSDTSHDENRNDKPDPSLDSTSSPLVTSESTIIRPSLNTTTEPLLPTKSRDKPDPSLYSARNPYVSSDPTIVRPATNYSEEPSLRTSYGSGSTIEKPDPSVTSITSDSQISAYDLNEITAEPLLPTMKKSGHFDDKPDPSINSTSETSLISDSSTTGNNLDANSEPFLPIMSKSTNLKDSSGPDRTTDSDTPDVLGSGKTSSSNLHTTSEPLLPTMKNRKNTNDNPDPPLTTGNSLSFVSSIPFYNGNHGHNNQVDLEGSYNFVHDVAQRHEHDPPGESGLDAHTTRSNGEVNLVRRSSVATSGTLNIPQGSASDYFERSIIEEFNYRIEAEQRDSSILSLPMVAAVLDDTTTTIGSTQSTNPAASVGQSQESELPLHNDTSVNNSGSTYDTSTATAGSFLPGPVQRQPATTIAAPLPRHIPVSKLTKLRRENGLPVGLVMEIARYQKFAFTFFVCDTNNIDNGCIMECAKLAEATQSQIAFYIGNNTETKEVLFPPPMDPRLNEVNRQRTLQETLHAYVDMIRSPTWSTTPPIRTIQTLMDLVQGIPTLQYWKIEKMSVVIATNRTFGTTDQNTFKYFATAIAELIKLQINVVIIVTNDDENVMAYYKHVMKVFPNIILLYSFEKEKLLVQKMNPWFNYGEPLHRLRQLGYKLHSTVDLLSERKLNIDELRVFFVEFYGSKVMLYSPDLGTEWDEFYVFLDRLNNVEGKHRLGIQTKNQQQYDYWIEIRKLDKIYGSKKFILFRPFRNRKSNNRASAARSKEYLQYLRVEI